MRLAQPRARLLAWFDRHQRDLPWRNTKDPYAIWLSEVMLQQTQVTTVIPYYDRFLARFPTVESLAKAPLDDVLGLWRGLGYYSRAKNLQSAARQICAEHGGRLPSNAEALRRLPGFGRYTAGAVASIAFGEPAPIVDGNVARVFSRYFELEGAPGDREHEDRLWSLAGQWVRGARPGDLNQALMELGALVCKPVAPSCSACPLSRTCLAFAHGRVDELPARRERPPRKRLSLAVAIFRRGPSLLLARNEKDGLFGGLWELPSAPRVGKQRPASALSSVLGCQLALERLGTIRRTLTHRDLVLELYAASGKPPHPGPHYREFRWVNASQARNLGMSTAMQKAFDAALGA